MRTVFGIIPLLLALRLSAQTNSQLLNPSLENIVPPSPNASALAKFGSIPVGPSTGIPQINVPLYTYENKGNGLKLNISLDYHAGGIRVDEVSSQIGIGWALNAGGAVSRVLRGIADELDPHGFISQPPLPQDEAAGNAPGGVLELRPFNRMYANLLDNQNDIFNFSFNGRSGKFMLGKNNDLLLINQQKLKIEKETSGTGINKMISKFTITDESGFKYVFAAAETSTDISRTHNTFTSSWFLTEIVAPSGQESIVLEYENTSIGTYALARTITESIIIGGDLGWYVEWPPMNGNTVSGQSISGKRLKTIRFPDGILVSFGYSTTERTDLRGDYLLNKITITDNNGSKRGYLLEQDYLLNRPTLKKVTPFGGSAETASAPYTFEYEGPLPDRLSLDQDHWGFYNYNNTGMFIPREIFPNRIGTYYELLGGNRDTHPERCKAGTLKKITWPAGGYTVFEMEANQAKDNWLDQQFTVTVAAPPYADKSTSVYLSSSSSYGSVTADVLFEGEPNTRTDFEITVPPGFGDCSGTCKIVAEVYPASNMSPGGGLTIQEIPYSENGGTKTFSLTGLSKGTLYKVVLYTLGLSNYAVYAEIKWRETRQGGTHTVEYSHKQPYVGGLRAKRILDYDGVNATPASVKEYEYVMEDGTTSSGALGEYPIYSFSAYYDYRVLQATAIVEVYTEKDHNFITRQSSPIQDIAYVYGSPVTYQRVVEKLVNNGQSAGRIERYFTSFAGNPPYVRNAFPFVPPDNLDWTYGLLKKELTYDKNGVLLKSVENEYKYSLDNFFADPVRRENFRSISIAPVRFLAESRNTLPPLITGNKVYFLMSSFLSSAGRADLAKTTTREYDPTGGQLETIVNYQYDADNFYLKEQSFINSKNENLVKQLYYPRDMVMAGKDPAGVYQAMVNRNIIHPVVEEVQRSNGRQLALKKVNYYNPFTDVYVPQTVQTQNGSDPVETRLRYHAYNSLGKVLTAAVENGMPVGYKWGYNGQYLVAECKNVASADFFYTGFEDDGITGNAHTGTKYFNGSYSTSDKLAPGLNGKTYLISYWYFNGSKWVFSGEQPYTGQALSGAIDDVRIYPQDAALTTFTYAPLTGVTSITDPAGKTTYYEYDAFGRLRLTRDQDGRIIQQYDYQYQQPITH